MAQEQKHGGSPNERPQQQQPEETQEERFEKNRRDIDSTTESEVSMHDDERTAANGSGDESLAAPNRGTTGSNNALEAEVSIHDDERLAANQSDEEIEGNQTSGGLDREEQRRAAGNGDF